VIFEKPKCSGVIFEKPKMSCVIFESQHVQCDILPASNDGEHSGVSLFQVSTFYLFPLAFNYNCWYGIHPPVDDM
jgi:hypothetical protein